MAHRLTVSDRAVREIGEAYEWYEMQFPHLGTEFLDAVDAQYIPRATRNAGLVVRS